MGWFSKSKKPKPFVGELRIVEVTLVNGKKRFDVESYDYHTYMCGPSWGVTGVGFKDFASARVHVDTTIGKWEKTRKVVWP